MKCLQNTPHLDPLPSSDEGRGNPSVSVNRPRSAPARERSAGFPLPFRRGEDQGEGLLQKTLSSLTKWKWAVALATRSNCWHKQRILYAKICRFCCRSRFADARRLFFSDHQTNGASG